MLVPRVLGFNLGTHKIGMVVLDQYSLFDSCGKTFPNTWSQKKRAIIAIIEQYLLDHRVKYLAVKIPLQFTFTIALTELLDHAEISANPLTFLYANIHYLI